MTRDELLERLVVEQHAGSPDEIGPLDGPWRAWWHREDAGPALLRAVAAASPGAAQRAEEPDEPAPLRLVV